MLPREGMETLVIDKSGVGGQAGITETVENYPGFPEGISGAELVSRIVKQVQRYDVEILQAQDVQEIGINLPFWHVLTGDGSTYSTNALLIATGADYRRLNVRGEDEYIGGSHFRDLRRTFLQRSRAAGCRGRWEQRRGGGTVSDQIREKSNLARAGRTDVGE